MAVSTFRFDKGLEADINRIAAREGKTKTQVVRDALREYTAKKRKEGQLNMAESMKAYIGAGKTKQTNLSKQSGETVRSVLLDKKKSGRL